MYFFFQGMYILANCFESTDSKQCISKKTNIYLSAHIGDNFKPLCNMHKIAMMAGLLRFFSPLSSFHTFFFLSCLAIAKVIHPKYKLGLFSGRQNGVFVCSKMMNFGLNHGLPETSPLFICPNSCFDHLLFSVYSTWDI